MGAGAAWGADNLTLPPVQMTGKYVLNGQQMYKRSKFGKQKKKS